jgi:hypothetical protein
MKKWHTKATFRISCLGTKSRTSGKISSDMRTDAIMPRRRVEFWLNFRALILTFSCCIPNRTRYSTILTSSDSGEKQTTRRENGVCIFLSGYVVCIARGDSENVKTELHVMVVAFQASSQESAVEMACCLLHFPSGTPRKIEKLPV